MPSCKLFLLLLTLFSLSLCDQWYMPDSNLISDAQFNSKIVQDKHSFKFVKYFTPHCPYCRYLKAAFDQLKHKKEWCFKIYDFNCQWYPQFCSQHVRSGSFPYTAIHDQQGNMIEEIHGFYPQPIISTIFDRIQERCMAARGTPVTISSHQQVPVPEQAHQLQTNHVQPAAIEPVEFHEQPKVQSPQKPTQLKTENQLNTDSHPSDTRPVEHENKPKVEEKKLQQQHTAQKHVQQPKKQQNSKQKKQIQTRTLNQKENTTTEHNKSINSYHNYLFYGVCLLCAGYYVYTLHSDKPNPEVQQNTQTINHSKTAGKVQKQSRVQQKTVVQHQPCVQQSELLEHIPDQEL